MTRKERILSILSRGLSPDHMELRDDSSKHAGHAGAAPGGESHYHLVIQSRKFAGLSKVQRHQSIYGLLSEEFKNGLHALSIEARAPGEN